MLTRAGWSAFIVALLVLCVLAPSLNLLLPKDSLFHLSDYAVALIGKIMCYAICALAMDLIWGYTGILSLGHGVFFALGGFAMGMYLMRQIGLDGNYKSALPDFMVFLDWKTLPWHWRLSDSFGATLFLIVAVPALVAFVFGFFAWQALTFFVPQQRLLLLKVQVHNRQTLHHSISFNSSPRQGLEGCYLIKLFTIFTI